MGKTTLARQKAIGAIGPARVAKLEAVGLQIVDAAEQAKLVQRRAELEREVEQLRREQALVLVGEIIK